MQHVRLCKLKKIRKKIAVTAEVFLQIWHMFRDCGLRGLKIQMLDVFVSSRRPHRVAENLREIPQ